MAIPNYQTLMLPVLRAVEHGPRKTATLVDELSEQFGLTAEERAERVPSGGMTRIYDRTFWAASDLARAGLLSRPERGVIAITTTGAKVLANPPDVLNRAFLGPYFGTPNKDHGNGAETGPNVVSVEGATPDEIIRAAHAEITDALAQDLLNRIQSSPPKFFEELIVDLLVRMDYGTGGDTARAIGQAGDDGVDGVINLDALGVDQVYFQAKRYKPGSSVSAGAMRDFFGALAMKDVTKGIFVTTSHFTPSAYDTADKLSKRIVLIDGPTLARLMIRHSVGCRVTETFPVSIIDESYFE